MFRQACFALTIAACAFGTASAAAPASPAATTAIPLKKDSGIYVVPVSANGSATFDCIVDSGASDVNIPTEVFRKLLRAGAVRQSDFVGMEEYTLADGSTQRGRTYRFKSLKVGNIVVANVVASVGGDGDSGLLGQSFLERFPSWSLDNNHHTLVLTGPPSAAPPAGHPDHPPIARPANIPPDTTSVAQTGGGHATDDGDSQSGVPARDPTDDRLTAQHSH